MADFLTAVDTDGGKAELTPVTLVSSGAEVGTASSPFAMAASGSSYADISVTLTAAQAAGTAPIIAANPARRGLIFRAAVDIEISLTASASVGQRVYASARDSLVGNECPTNAIYLVAGFVTAGQTITIWSY